MKFTTKLKKYSIVFLLGIILISNKGKACTGIRLQAKDGSVVFARTLEFAKNLNSQIILIPRGYAFRGITPSGTNGLAWKSKYAAIGTNFESENYLLDGFNEKGLYGGLFYFPNFAKYQEIDKSDYSKTLAPQQLLNWVLTNFNNIENVKNSLQKIKVANIPYPKWNMVLPLHMIVTDIKGNSAVFEYVNGKLNIYDNPFGVFTNAPDFDWHTMNITNYLNLSSNNIDKKNIAGKQLQPFGEGSGLFGIPGDFTPPSRFIRALFLKLASIPTNNSKETICQAFHILNSFDIPKGAIRSEKGNVIESDYTQWTTASDLNEKNYYYKTENNSRIRVINLMKCDLGSKNIKRFTMEVKTEDILDVTKNLK